MVLEYPNSVKVRKGQELVKIGLLIKMKGMDLNPIVHDTNV